MNVFLYYNNVDEGDEAYYIPSVSGKDLHALTLVQGKVDNFNNFYNFTKEEEQAALRLQHLLGMFGEVDRIDPEYGSLAEYGAWRQYRINLSSVFHFPKSSAETIFVYTGIIY